MVSAVGGISVLDSLAAIARIGVRGGDGSERVEPAPSERALRRDRVDLSDAAHEAVDAGEEAPAEPAAEAKKEPSAATASGDDAAVPESEQKQVEELKARDRAVRLHEQAHRAAAGSLAGPISYSYATGPDGRRYATEGSVPIDTSPVEGDPEATIRKMQRVKQAALAPAEPSGADRQIASRASQRTAQARIDLRTGATDPTDRETAPTDAADETGETPETGDAGATDAPGTRAETHAPHAAAATAVNPHPSEPLVDVYA